MDQEIQSFKEVRMPVIGGLERTTCHIGALSGVAFRGEPVIERLVVSDLTDGRPIFGFKTVSKRQYSVIDVLCCNANLSQLQFSFFQVVILDVGPKLVDRQRKEFV